VHFLDRVGPAPLRTVAIGIVLKVRLEDRFQNKLGSGLNHPIPDCRDAEWAFSASRLRDHHPPHRLWPVRLRDEILMQARQPVLNAQRINLGEGDSVHTWCSRIRAGQRVSVVQYVFATNLVVEQIEAESGLRLRLAIELPLKGPDLFRSFKAHRQSPGPRHLRKHARSQGPFLRRHYPASLVIRPCPTPARSAAQIATLELRTPTKAGLPRLLVSPFQRAVPTYPGGSNGCLCRLRPRSRGLPRF